MNSYTYTSIIVPIFVYNNIIILVLVQILICQFLENGNSYIAEDFNVN